MHACILRERIDKVKKWALAKKLVRLAKSHEHFWFLTVLNVVLIALSVGSGVISHINVVMT